MVGSARGSGGFYVVSSVRRDLGNDRAGEDDERREKSG